MNKKFKKSVSAALICAMMLTTATTALNVSSFADNTTVSATESKSYKITQKKVNTYLFTQKANKTPVCFVNGSDVPYMKIDDFVKFYKEIGQKGYEVSKFDIKLAKKDNKVMLQRENGVTVIIDFDKDTFDFIDYNAFVEPTGEMLMNIGGATEKSADGSYRYLKKLSTSNQLYGDEIIFDLSEYDIDLVRSGENYYIPLQTLSDVFLARGQVNLLFNGKTLIAFNNGASPLVSGGGLTEIGKTYYDESVKGKVSKAMAKYNYNELCFAFDNLYGLKEQHNIKSFRKLVQQRGLEGAFLSTDPKKIDTAIYRIINENLNDIHSSYQFPSYATGLADGFAITKKYPGSRALTDLTVRQAELTTARTKYNPDGVSSYVEIGDTAFITFDQFTPKSQEYYENKPTEESADTMGIIAYSVQQILRKGSPIKNVVLDLSCNIGGDTSAAIYTIGAFLGTASVSVEDPNTGALATYDYKVDTNFDGKFNSKDTLNGKGLNLYCLISGVSFSSGNFVPNVFKNSGKVTLIGQTSGGGSCTVLPMCTALGSLFNMSSFIRMSFTKNGSFYDIDRGADPDIYLSKADSYYDREGLVEYIKGIK